MGEQQEDEPALRRTVRPKVTQEDRRTPGAKLLTRAVADIVAEVKSDKPVRLRVVGKPNRLCAILLQKLGLKLPTLPKIIENNVVKTS